jgi:protein PsiE
MVIMIFLKVIAGVCRIQAKIGLQYLLLHFIYKCSRYFTIILQVNDYTKHSCNLEKTADNMMSQQNESIRPNFKVPLILQGALNSALVLLAVSLSVLLGKEIFYIIRLSVFNQGVDDHYLLLERILIYFFYFEFIAMKYFQENYHFPLRYFLYIGITRIPFCGLVPFWF